MWHSIRSMDAGAVRPETNQGGSESFDAFVSYRRVDGLRYADSLRRRLRDFQLPPELATETRRRPLEIYIDRIYEAAEEDFFEKTIKPALRLSRHLIVVQTPAVLQPRVDGTKNWVDREIEFFRTLPQGRNVSVALAKGSFADPLPDSIRADFENIERVDIRRLRSWTAWYADDLILPFVAKLRGISPVQMPILQREDARRRSRRLGAALAVAGLATFVLTGATVFAFHERNLARTSAETAKDREREEIVQRTLAEAATAEADKQARLAREQRDLATLQTRLAEERELAIRAALIRESIARRPVEALKLAIEVADESLRRFHNLLPVVQDNLKLAVDSSLEKNILTGHGAAIMALAFNQDESRMFSASYDGTIGEWDWASRKLLRKFVSTRGVSSVPHLMTMSVSPDGKLLVAGYDSGKILIWDVAGRVSTAAWEAHDSGVTAVTFSPDGSTVASGGRDNSAQVWTLDGKSLGQRLVGHVAAVTAIGFSPDGYLLGTAAEDGVVRIYRRDGRSVGEPSIGHRGAVRTLSFSPDGNYLATGGADQTVRLWGREGAPIGAPFTGHEASVTSLLFAPDGQSVITASLDRTIRVWDLKGRQIGQPLRGHAEGINALALMRDGRTLASGAGTLGAALEGERDNGIRLWDLGSSLLAKTSRVGDMVSIAVSPDGRLLATGGDELHLWNVRGLPVGPPFSKPSGTITAVVFVGNDRLITGGTDGGDGVVRAWDLRGRNSPVTYMAGEGRGSVMSVATNQKKLLIVTSDGMLQVWDVNEGRVTRAWPTKHTALVNMVALSPDGTRIATASDDRTIRLFDGSGRMIAVLTGHAEDVRAVTFSPNGELIASGSSDRTVRLWQASDGKPVGKPLQGHNGPITSVAFSPSSTFVISGSGDRTIRLWDTGGRQVGAPFYGHEESVEAVAFGTDGDWMASVSRDGALRMWRSDWVGWLRLACERLKDHPLFRSVDSRESNTAKRTCSGPLAARVNYGVLSNDGPVDREGTRREWSGRSTVGGEAAIGLTEAVRRNFPELVELLLSTGAKVDVPDRGGDTALMVAAESGNRRLLELLIRHGANVNVHNQRGESALTKALGGSRGDLANLLLGAGANRERAFESREGSRYSPMPDKYVPRELDEDTLLGLAYENGKGEPQSFERAAEQYRRAAMRGIGYAQFRLGRLYSFGAGVPASDVDAVKWYQAAAASGDNWGMRNLGVAYLWGEGVYTDRDLALELFFRAARNGNPRAYSDLGEMFRLGRGVSRDAQRARLFHQLALDSGEELSEQPMARLLEGGLGGRRDDRKAAALFTAAATRGDVAAEFALGWMYESGQGIERALDQAMKWYRVAGDAGNTEAQIRLGRLYESGELVQQSLPVAFSWFERAALQNSPEAQMELARLYESGRGVERSVGKALEWYGRAAASGYDQARQALLRLKRGDP
jgi:WD40 repeat protein/TPR repeat protein